jgi:hypothetical protein
MSDRSGVGLASLAVLESCLIWRVLPWPTPSGEGYTIGNRARFLCVCWRPVLSAGNAGKRAGDGPRVAETQRQAGKGAL